MDLNDFDFDVFVLFGPVALVALVLIVDFLFAVTGHPAPIWPGNPLPGWLSA